MKSVKKKLRLKRIHQERVVPAANPPEDIEKMMTERQELVQRLVKVGCSWRYIASHPPEMPMNTNKMDVVVEDVDGRSARPDEIDPKQKDVEPITSQNKLPPGAVVVEARHHPELRVYIQLAKAGIDINLVQRIMDNSQLDSDVITNPKKLVMLERKYQMKQKKALEEYQIERETPEDIKATKEKLAHITRRMLLSKVDPSTSLKEKQLAVLRVASSVYTHRDHFSRFVWRSKLGDESSGYTIDLSDVLLTKGVMAILDGVESGSTADITVATQVPIRTPQTLDIARSAENGDDETANSTSSSKATLNFLLDFTHGSLVYKLERTVIYLQMLGLVASLDVDWPPSFNLMSNWTTVFLDGHFYLLTFAHKYLRRIGQHFPQSMALPRLVDMSSRYTDLYYYRDIVKYVYSIFLGPVLLLSLFRLWEIDDYTDPATTDRWVMLYVEKWFRRGLPRSFGCVFLFSVFVFGILVGIAELTYGVKQGHYVNANAIWLVGWTFALYVWIIFALLATAWRCYFRTRVPHNRSYATIALLKESVSAKFTLCFVLLFLTYLPTCFYIVGAARPIYPAKVWSRHSAETFHEPLKGAYRHVVCYYISFPPRIRPKIARARRGRIKPPGFASYAPHAYHPHKATNRVDCDSRMGVLIFSVSVVAFVVYIIGLPLTIYHLVNTANSQLHSCEWWHNYQTAWRRFNYVLAECEEYTFEQVLVTAMKLWKHNTKEQAEVFARLCIRTLRRTLTFISKLVVTILQTAHYLFRFFRGEAALTKKKQRKRGTHTAKVIETMESTGMSETRSHRLWHFIYRYFWRQSLSTTNSGKRKKRFAYTGQRADIPTKGIRLKLYRIIQTKWFNGTVTVAVLLSLAPVFAQRELEASIGARLLDVLVTWVIGMLFIMEFLIKMIALNPRQYFRSRFNTLDFVLILLWLLDVAIQSGTNFAFLRSLRALRSVRTLRIFRMARTLRLLKLSHQLDPIFNACRSWILRWVADTPQSSALIDQMERSAKEGMWRINKSLPAKIEKMKRAYLHAKREYAISFDEFIHDHELIIEKIDYVVDTSALGYLIRPFRSNASFWRVVLLAENVVFCAILTWLRASQFPWVQCLAGALVSFSFGLATAMKRPYMYLNERKLDEVARSTVFALLITGFLLDITPREEHLARRTLEIFAVVAILVSAARILHCLRVTEAIRNVFHLIIREFDGAVLKLVTGCLDVKAYILEDSNVGLKLIQQWDDLLNKQWATGFIAWPAPIPRNLLATRQKAFHIKWAALRGMYLSTLRTPTGQCILHSAMLRGEPEAVAWILFHHPKLLNVIDEERDSPVTIALKELAKTLLAHERHPTPKTAWKRAKLAEILLSDQVQHYLVPWSLPHFRALGDIAVPLLGQLVQHLALALNLRPPLGFVRVSTWMQFPGDIPNFLAQCFLACRDEIEVPHCELGDVGWKTIHAILGALQMSQTSVTVHSNFFNFYPINIVRLVAPYNRLRDDTGVAIALAVRANNSLTYLDVRHNNLGDEAGVALAQSLEENKCLTNLSLAYNRCLSDTGVAFAKMLKANRHLRSLDLANNRLGPRMYWPTRFEKVDIPSSGPSLCASLRFNLHLTCLNLSDNNLGPNAAIELEKAFHGNPSSALLSLGIAGNNLGAKGCKALTYAVTSRVCLTHLDAARNCFGAKVGGAFATAIKKNQQLTYLDLSQNFLGTTIGQGIALALCENKNLTSLEAAHNDFGPDALRAFANLLCKESSSPLVYLGLAHNRFGVQSYEGGRITDVGSALGKGLASCQTLTGIDLRDLRFSKNELLAFLSGFAANRSLVHIALDGQEFNNASVLQLTNSLDRHRRRVRPVTRPTSRGTTAAALMNFGGLAELRVSNGLTSISLRNCQLGARAGPVAVGALLSLKNLTELKLAGNRMGPKLGEHLGDVLKTQCRDCIINLIDLSDNLIGETGGLSLARAMEVNTSLTDVDLSSNGLTPSVGTALADALCELVESGIVSRPAHCKRLVLANNKIGTAASQDLFISLRSSVTRTINFSRNRIGPGVGEVIAQCLRRNTNHWCHLNLEGNELGKAGVNPIFWALRRNSSLTELLLARNGIGPDFGTERDEVGEHGNSLAAAIEHNYTISTLDLALNDISCDCGIVLTQALKENSALTELNFEGNSFDGASGDAIAAKLKNDVSLRSIMLSGNNIGWDGGLAMARQLELNSTLLYLDISFNNLGSNGPATGCALAVMISKNSSLRHLDLEGNLLGREAGMSIGEAISKNNTLVTLNVRDNHFDLDVGAVLLKCLAENSTLMDLGVSIEEVGDDLCADIVSLAKARATSRGIGTYDIQQKVVSQRRRSRANPQLPKLKFSNTSSKGRTGRSSDVEWAIVRNPASPKATPCDA